MNELIKTVRNIAILDPSRLTALNGEQGFEHQVKHWCAAGIHKGMDACYVRAYNLSKADVKEVTATIRRVSPNTVIIIPYIYADLAHHADGLHLRENDDYQPPMLCKDVIIGKSCHSLTSIRNAEMHGMSYVFYSPIFETQTHPEAKGAGLKALEKTCKATSLPVFALGGINSKNVESCIEAGAHGIAAIGMFLNG